MGALDPDARPPRLRANAITIGTSRPHDLAQFYARLLDLPVTADDPAVPDDPVRGGWAQVRPPDGSGMTLNFEYERYFTRPTWPSGHPRRPPARNIPKLNDTPWSTQPNRSPYAPGDETAGGLFRAARGWYRRTDRSHSTDHPPHRLRAPSSTHRPT